jgi:hypothetical protein
LIGNGYYEARTKTDPNILWIFEGAVLYSDLFKMFKPGKQIINHVPKDCDLFRDKSVYSNIVRQYWENKGCDYSKVMQRFYNLHEVSDCKTLMEELENDTVSSIYFLKKTVSSEGDGVTPMKSKDLRDMLVKEGESPQKACLRHFHRNVERRQIQWSYPRPLLVGGRKTDGRIMLLVW